MTRMSISVGETYGKITVVGKIQRDGYCVHLCRCNLCGNEFTARGKQFHDSVEKGCPECRGRHKIVVGKTYGKITVISRIQRGSYFVYLCRCSLCGNEFTAKGKQFLNCVENGCPECRKKERQRLLEEKYKNYIGNEYGSLTVTGYVGLKMVKGRGQGKFPLPVMLCRCEKCGSETEIPLDRLKAGGAKQCAECSRKILPDGREIGHEMYVDGTSILAIDGRRKINKNSSTGHNGVSYMSGQGMYRAYINFKRKQYHLGTYSKIEDAIAARKEAEKNVYGEFLKWYAETYPEKWERIRKKDKD